MNNSFEVVTSVVEIAKLNKQLAERLSKTFRHGESREISYPSGHHTGDVYFEYKTGDNVRAWAPHALRDKLLNFMLSGEPGASKWLEIAVQLNFPAGTYNRRMAGVFVRDSVGDLFVAHRGKLTKGHAGLRKDDVLEEFAPMLIEAKDGVKTSTVILIGSLDDPDLADRLCEFAAEAREVATKLGGASDQDGDQQKIASKAGKGHAGPGKRKKSTPVVVRKRMLKLRKYFNEYSGEGRTKGHEGGKRTVEHGDIVKALDAHLGKTGETQKAQAIDLAVVSLKHVALFEVKTSARTTDVYTGVGQLLIHGECVAELMGLPVRRYLVLPDRPSKAHEPHIVKKGEMRIVTFQKSKSGYCFTGI